MTKAQIYSKLLNISEKSYYRWKAKDHIFLIKLLEKYFLDEEIEEFLLTGKIQKFDFFLNNNYLVDKSIKLYDSIDLKLSRKAKNIFFEQLNNLKDYKIENISNIIFYEIKNEDLNLPIFDDSNNISKMSIRLNLLQVFQNIDSFEIEYFIKNLKQIRKESFLHSILSHKYKYNPDIFNINEFEAKFFKIEKDNFFRIKNFEITKNKVSLFLDIHNKNNEIIEDNKKIDLSEEDVNIFLDLISY